MDTNIQAFDPVSLAASLEKTVCENATMKYTAFYASGPRSGVSTGYSAGCCLRCIFCSADNSRDEPEKFGRFYSPEQVLEELLTHANIKGVKRLRLSGGEPTLCRVHLSRILELIQGTDTIMTLETNGILLGADEGYVKDLSRYQQFHVRVSLKAGTPVSFQNITGAKAGFFELPFKALQFMMKYKLSFHAAAMTDSRIMPPEEKEHLLKLLQESGYKEFLEEETCKPYPETILRLQNAGIKVFSEQ